MTERALMPDYLRLFAIFGIVVVNVQYIAFSALQDFIEPTAATFADAIAMWLVNGLALLKTYGLFSFMFGVGLGFLMQSAQRQDLSFGRIYRNRIIGLALLGFFHGCLFFLGDILVTYAITGSILYLFRHWAPRRLVIVGACLITLQTIIALPTLFLPADMPADFILFEQESLTQGGFLDAVVFRSIAFAFSMPFLLIFQGTSALGWFCIGLACVKSGMIDNADHPLWARARRYCLWPGLVVSLLGAGFWQWGATLPGAALTIAVAPFVTVGYLGLIAAVSRPAGPMMSRALGAGGSSLSIYLGQSIILSTIFSGYGLGLWEHVDRITAVAIAVLVTVALMVVVSIWRIWAKTGPFEWILRRITFAGTRKAALQYRRFP